MRRRGRHAAELLIHPPEVLALLAWLRRDPRAHEMVLRGLADEPVRVHRLALVTAD